MQQKVLFGHMVLAGCLAVLLGMGNERPADAGDEWVPTPPSPSAPSDDKRAPAEEQTGAAWRPEPPGKRTPAKGNSPSASLPPGSKLDSNAPQALAPALKVKAGQPLKMPLKGGVTMHVPRTPSAVAAYLALMRTIIDECNRATLSALTAQGSNKLNVHNAPEARDHILELVHKINSIAPPNELKQEHKALAATMNKVGQLLVNPGDSPAKSLPLLFQIAPVMHSMNATFEEYHAGCRKVIKAYGLSASLDPFGGDNEQDKRRAMGAIEEMQGRLLSPFGQNERSTSPSGAMGNSLGKMSSGFGEAFKAMPSLGGSLGSSSGGMPDLAGLGKLFSGMSGSGDAAAALPDLGKLLGGISPSGQAGEGGFPGGGSGLPDLGQLLNSLSGGSGASSGTGSGIGGLGSSGLGSVGKLGSPGGLSRSGGFGASDGFGSAGSAGRSDIGGLLDGMGSGGGAGGGSADLNKLLDALGGSSGQSGSGESGNVHNLLQNFMGGSSGSSSEGSPDMGKLLQMMQGQ